MRLATEYFVRSGAAKQLELPCSLFVVDLDSFEKKVITVSPATSLPDKLVVKHWLVSSCRQDQALPSIREFIVSRPSLFADRNIVLPRHRLLQYQEEPVPFNFNSVHHPMMAETYNRHCDHFFNTDTHRLSRLNWLWKEFVRIYVPSLWNLTQHIIYSSYKNDQDRAEDQRLIVSKHYPERWLWWLKWRRYMLDHTPGELAFSAEYANVFSTLSASVSPVLVA